MASFQLTRSFHCLCCPSSTFLFSLVVDQMYLGIQDSPERKVCSKSCSQGIDHCGCGEHHPTGEIFHPLEGISGTVGH